MQSSARAILCLLTAALLSSACAMRPDPARPPAAPPPAPPEAGQTLSELLSQLEIAAGASTVRLEDTQLRRTDVDPWQELKLREAKTVETPLALVALRRCTLWEGVRRQAKEMTSWYLFRGRRLAAYDHASFDGRCAVLRDFRPSPADEPEPERSLWRWVAQRHPNSALETGDRFRLALALVEAGRIEEGRRWLRSASRDLQVVSSRVRLENSAREAALDAQVERWKALRRQVVRALEKAEEEAEAKAAAPTL